MEILNNPFIWGIVVGFVLGVLVAFGICFVYKHLKDFALEIVKNPIIKHLRKENKNLKVLLESKDKDSLPMNRM